MKILDITLRNLNSLRGEWKIDFSDPAYKTDGIFAVTGPTGAGKTTIFDAVCLALYGRTPRLTSRSKEELSEIMSKHTKYCMAKITFEAGGKTYVCKWSMARKADVLSTEHTITEDGLKKNGASSRVAEITGLDYRRFTQAALLAQGEFDAFLKGNTSERAKILELLTDSGKYGEISSKIAQHAERAKEERDKLMFKRDEMTPRDDFGSDEEISQSITETNAALSVLKRECSELESAVLWLGRIRDIRCGLSQTQLKIDTLRISLDSFAEERTRLDAGIRARAILHEYSSLAELRKQYIDGKSQFEQKKQQLEDSRSKLAVAEREIMTLEAELERMTAGLPESETPESICEKAKSRLQAFIDAYMEKAKISSDREKAESEYKQAKAALASAMENDESAREKYEQARSRVHELSNARVSAILEAERRNLSPGVPCPVCGSLEHPAAGHFVTNSDTSGKILHIDNDLKTAQERENQALRISQEAGKKLSDAQNYEGICRLGLEQSVRLENECGRKILEARSSVSEVIEKIGIHNPKSCEEITSRVKKWKSDTDNLSGRISDKKNEIISLRTQIEENSKTLEENSTALEGIGQELRSREESFRESLAAKNFESEKQFNEACRITDGEIASLQHRAQDYDNEMSGLQAVRDDKIKQLEEEEAKAVTAMTLEEAEPLFSRKKDESDALNRKLISLEEAEKSRKKLKAEYDKLNEECRAKEEIYSRWKKFNDELGQKNGGAFRKFAQKITLRMLVQLANTQLEKINSRYTLISTPKKDDELCLSVKDSEQAGTVRTTENLSGGEKFIISLALALGLSQISGSRAQVDSLFIDEGFGSLDEEALSSALDALGEIRREGRMIGIISHISGISERITAKINVIRKSEGTSIITGPGCSGSI